MRPSKAKKARRPETSAEALFNGAREYQLAANKLLPLGKRVESPLYFLYTHAIELALKAYLRCYGLGASHHALPTLLKQCEGKGLPVHADMRLAINLLESENMLQGFRYFTAEGTGRPKLAWLREVVGTLIFAVIEKVSTTPTKSRRVVAMKFVVSKPFKKSRPAS